MSSAAMSLAVLVPVAPGTSKAALVETLSTLSWATEIVVADAAGLALMSLPGLPPFQQLALPALEALNQVYRAAHGVQADWLLVLQPGQTLTPEAQEPLLEALASETLKQAVYALPRVLTWQDLTWFEPPEEQAVLMQRTAFIDNPLIAASPHPLPQPVYLHQRIAPEQLTPWLYQAAEDAAQTHLRRHGTQGVACTLHPQWVCELLGLGVMAGLLKGHLFRSRSQRLTLFLRLLKAHLKWFTLYRLLRSETSPFPPTGRDREPAFALQSHT